MRFFCDPTYVVPVSQMARGTLQMVIHPLRLPGLVNKQFANSKISIEIVDLPINSMVIFHSFLYVYQAGYV